MKGRRRCGLLRRSYAAVAVAAVVAALVAAGCGGSSGSQTTDLLAAQQGADRYKNYYTALADDYISGLVCATGDLLPSEGAAGVHLGNYQLIRDGKLDVRKPEILVYIPTETDYRLVAVEYVVPDTGQDAPTLFGQKFTHFNASGTPGFTRASPGETSSASRAGNAQSPTARVAWPTGSRPRKARTARAPKATAARHVALRTRDVGITSSTSSSLSRRAVSSSSNALMGDLDRRSTASTDVTRRSSSPPR